MSIIQKIKNFALVYRLPILAGFLIGTSYIPLPPWALLFCLSPLFLFWMKVEKTGRAFFGGWITQFILTLLGFPWIAYTAIEFGHFPWWGGALALIGFAAIAHLHYAFAGLIGFQLVKRLKLTPFFALATYALVFAICELLVPMIFPWHLGYPWLWAKFPGAQVADVIGFEGLNLVTILANVLITAAIAGGLFKTVGRIDSVTLPRKKAIRLFTAAILLFAAVNILGWDREKPWQATDAELPILAVQGNIGNFDKLMAERGRDFGSPIVEKYISLSQSGLVAYPETKLVVWPETAFPDYLDRGYVRDPLQTRVTSYVTAAKVPLLTGSYSFDPVKHVTYNGLFFVDQMGQVPLLPYRKSLLLVFGETFPFSDVIPYMDKLFPNLGSFGRGEGPHVMPLSFPGKIVRVGAQICYEGLYPWFSASLSRQGAEMIVNVTNDSWFGTNFEPYQHLYMTMARAIEFRRPLLRATNTGITTAILASGEKLEMSPQDQEWAGLFRIRYQTNPQHTFFERIANLWQWFLFIGLIVTLALGVRSARATGKIS